MGDGREVFSEVCPLCKGWFSPLTKKVGYVIIKGNGPLGMIRVCSDCDEVYDVLCTLNW